MPNQLRAARIRILAVAVLACLAGCGRQAPAPSKPVQAAQSSSSVQKVELRQLRWRVRATGLIQPVEAVTVPVPQLVDGGELVLTKIVASGTQVKEGDIVAEFDRTRPIERARDAQAKFEDLQHQVEQRKAQQRSDAEKRASDLQQAEADLAKARLELRKGPLLSDIDHLKAESKLEIATAHVASLKKSGKAREVAAAADLKILELQRERQRVAMERARQNADRLQIRAPLAGMVAQEVVWRQDQPGHPQEGDQLWPGQPLVRIFASTEMEVQVSVAEPDGAMLAPGARALVRMDAYPDAVFPAHFDAASPVASSSEDSSVRTFPARFRLESKDLRLLPDLSAAVDVEMETPRPVLAVPRASVRYRSGEAYVIQATAQGERERRIELGRAFDDAFIEVTSGIQAGDEVVTSVAVKEPQRMASR